MKISEIIFFTQNMLPVNSRPFSFYIGLRKLRWTVHRSKHKHAQISHLYERSIIYLNPNYSERRQYSVKTTLGTHLQWIGKTSCNLQWRHICCFQNLPYLIRVLLGVLRFKGILPVLWSAFTGSHHSESASTVPDPDWPRSLSSMQLRWVGKIPLWPYVRGSVGNLQMVVVRSRYNASPHRNRHCV